MINDRWFKLLFVAILCIGIGACIHAPVCEISDIRGGSNIYGSSTSRVLIMYKSKYGSTKQYAEWIHREIPSRMADVDKCNAPEFTKYDVIVFGGYVRTGRIVVAPMIVENWNIIKGKQVVLFTTSGTPPEHPNINKIYNASLPYEIRKDIKYFPLRGRMLHKDLSIYDESLVAVGRMMERDEALKRFMTEDFDEVKQENIYPVLEYIKAQLTSK
ncbi:MAG TPA: flavodoxin domain-containing protein [Syntrophales bacterium]|nr:flavodoxin domain-containing protein [Syntrophales bacterium]